MKRFNKRGMMDDLFDFLFTVTAAFFLLMFLGAILNGGVSESNDQAITKVVEFRQMESAVNNLRIQIYQQDNFFTIEEIDNQIVNSKVLAGRVITSCYDYITEVECNSDVMAIYEQPGICSWSESICSTLFEEDAYDYTTNEEEPEPIMIG
jgi:hypothetical protein